MKDKGKAVVLLSGGMDSCVSAAIAVDLHGSSNVSLLHASYGQRTQQRERRASMKLQISTESNRDWLQT